MLAENLSNKLLEMIIFEINRRQQTFIKWVNNQQI